MIVVDARKAANDLTMSMLADEIDALVSSTYTSDEMSEVRAYGWPPVKTCMYPDEIWITQWQQDNIFNNPVSGLSTQFRGIKLTVKEK